MRIAIVVNSFPKLSESFIFNKVMRLRRQGFSVSVLAHDLTNDLAAFRDRLGNEPVGFVQYSPLAVGNSRRVPAMARSAAGNLPLALRLARVIGRQYGRGRRAMRAWALAFPLLSGRFDVVHFESTGLAVLYRDALPFLGETKLITSCRGSAERILPLVHPERQMLLREILGAMDRIHCVSEEMQRTVSHYGLDPRKAFVNHPSVDPEQFKRTAPYTNRPDGPYNLLSVGRLVWSKGLEYAVIAVKLLVDHGYDLHYELVGEGPETERLRFAIQDMALGERVWLRGKQPGHYVRDALERADICIIPSLSEGLSNVALEAMAMEVPVVSTAVGGMPELISDGVDGLLVPSRDPEALAGKVASLLDDAARRARIGRNGRERVLQHFALDRHVALFAQEYTALVARQDRASRELLWPSHAASPES